MSDEKIQEAYERFDDFEKQLLGVKEVTWTPDEEITSKIHYDILSENFGEEEVQKTLETNGIEIKYLSNHDTFLKIFEMLKQ